MRNILSLVTHHSVESVAKTVHLKIKRQAKPDTESHWEEFEVSYRPNMNVITALQDIQKNPLTREGRKTTPVVWDCNCLEEVCGACSMIINGRVRQACSALIDTLTQPITLGPMTKFPIIRDLVVDRNRMFESLKKVKSWIPLDGTYDLGPGPRMPESERRKAYDFARCMTCGCCLEACPQVNPNSKFMGPAALGQVRLFNSHPTGAMNKEERLEALMGPDGIVNCSNDQNCVKACPKEIPLTDAIAELQRELTLYGIFGLMKK
jgi:succinate dehydrogenase / fumarate reductase iron-sulfur subunit